MTVREFSISRHQIRCAHAIVVQRMHACACKILSCFPRHKFCTFRNSKNPQVRLPTWFLRTYYAKFKWRYDRRSGNCNWNNCKFTWKKNSGLQMDLNPCSLQLLKMQLPQRRSYLHLNLYLYAVHMHHLHC